MLELDPFFQRVQDYTGTSYPVTESDLEITLAQQRAFIDRFNDLHSPLDLDTTALEMRAAGEIVASDEDIMSLTGLAADDNYHIFGASVWLEAKEALDTPDQSARISTVRPKPSELGEAVMLLSKTTYEIVSTDEAHVYPHFYETDRVLDRELVAELARIAKRIAEEMGIVELQLPEKVEEPGPLISIQQFTQARWGEAMLLLDMISDLQYLGITNTDDLVTG